MAKNVIILKKAAAQNIDSYNRSAVYTTDLDNGDVFTLASYSATAGEKEVWSVSAPTASSSQVWMAVSSEVSVITDAMGNKYIGLTKDPRAFTNVANKPFDAIKLNTGDLIEFTGEGYTNIATNAYLNIGTGFKLTPASSASATGLYLVKRKTDVLHINTGSIGGASIPTYVYEVNGVVA